MTIRPLIDTDYETLCGFWNDWGWVAPEKDFLPDMGTGGIMILDKEIPICAGFIYATNSKACWIDWIISNKEYRHKEKRKKAITLLVDSLTNIGVKSGYKYMYALLKHEGLIKTYESLGYFKGDSATEMIKVCQ